MRRYFLILIVALAACGGQSANNGNTVGNAVNANRANTNTAGNAANNAGNANAQPKADNISQVFSNTALPPEERVAAIQKYVDEIEARLPKENQSSSGSLQRKEVSVKTGSLKDATDENWAKIHFYSDGEILKRLKAYAPEGSEKSEEFYFYEKSEEFYFYNDKPVFVFIEPKGKNLESGDQKTAGDRFYFGDEGLISWVKADGNKTVSSDPEFKEYNDKLNKEAAAFKKLK